MTRCKARGRDGRLVSVEVKGYRYVDLAGESVLFAAVVDPEYPNSRYIIEYQSGERAKAGSITELSHTTLLTEYLDKQIAHYGARETLAAINNYRDMDWSVANEVDF